MRGLFPVQEVRCLCEFTQGRLHERKEQPGHLYFDGLMLHSSHKAGLGLSLEGGGSIFASITISVLRKREDERRGLSPQHTDAGEGLRD